jgi:transcriptional regulator with XRE-family HTH domain
MQLTSGELMKIHRVRKGLTQEGLAERMESYQVRVSRIENGIDSPTTSEIELIEKLLEVAIWSLGKGG